MNNQHNQSGDIDRIRCSSAKSCTAKSSNSNALLKIDNCDKGLHIDIYRGLFASKQLDSLDSTAATTSSSTTNNNNSWYEQLLRGVKWHRVKYKSNRFQKECETPCWTAFYGGRSEYQPYTPIPTWFQPLVDQVKTHLAGGNGNGAVRFNSFLIRLYFDGKDEIAWHTDGRTFLGEEPTIASLSLGCKATFQLRRMNNVWPCADGSKSTKGCVDVDTNTPIESFVLGDGDLLVMRGKTQKHWHHRVPKEKGRGVRLNINFRYIMPGVDAERGQRTYYKYMVYGDHPMDTRSEPPSWTFEEIMAKRGGIMNFVMRGLKKKIEVKSVLQQKGDCILQSTGKNADADAGEIKEGQTTEHSSTEVNANINSDYELSSAQQYLASDQGVDNQVFNALPIDIKKELVSQWKSQQINAKQSIVVYEQSSISSTDPKRKHTPNKNASNDKRTKKARAKKGTLDSFFSKK
jgi:alkylated DNA repair dioxygenase AlkB